MEETVGRMSACTNLTEDGKVSKIANYCRSCPLNAPLNRLKLLKMEALSVKVERTHRVSCSSCLIGRRCSNCSRGGETNKRRAVCVKYKRGKMMPLPNTIRHLPYGITSISSIAPKRRDSFVSLVVTGPRHALGKRLAQAAFLSLLLLFYVRFVRFVEAELERKLRQTCWAGK